MDRFDNGSDSDNSPSCIGKMISILKETNGEEDITCFRFNHVAEEVCQMMRCLNNTSCNLAVNDIKKNVEKIREKVNKESIWRKKLASEVTLKEAIMSDLSKVKAKDCLPTESLSSHFCWIARALNFVSTFCKNISTGEGKESVQCDLIDAYERCLKNHHSYPIQMMFSVMCKIGNKKYQIAEMLGSFENNRKQDFMDLHNELEIFLSRLKVLFTTYKRSPL